MFNFLKQIKNSWNKMKMGHASYNKDGIRPVHDWNIMLITVSVTLCFLAIIALYFYMFVDEEKLFTVEVDESQKEVKINADALTKVVTDINNRESLRQKIEQNQLSEPDPSL